MRRWITVSVALLASLAVAAAALADPGHESKSKGKSKKMSFVVTTTDNGSCGNPWATDVLQRTFTVKAKGDGTYPAHAPRPRDVHHARSRQPGRL